MLYPQSSRRRTRTSPRCTLLVFPSPDPPMSILFDLGFCLRLRMARIAMNSWCSACASDTPSHRYASAAPLLRCCNSSVFAVVAAVTTPIYGGSRHIDRAGGALPTLNGYIATPAQRPAAAMPAGRKPQRFLTMGRVPLVPELDADFHLAQCSLYRVQFRLSARARSLLLLLCCRHTIYRFPPTFRPRYISSLPIFPARLCNAKTCSCATLSRSFSCSWLIMTYLLLVHSTSRSFRCIMLRTLVFNRL
ncbi:hypothetical protein K438DRAFT_1011096 [Mycena galopus ATCC 62051]|nr:hypothetical protein K438DRAFT_1011096 [Mycena galopus ATCC 62051]